MKSMLEKSDAAFIQSVAENLLKKQNQVLIAIDGRCASGKTTLANSFAESVDCNVFHMDDFFLCPEMRTMARLSEPGGNVDYERFRSEVLIPLKSGIVFRYRPYSCRTQDFSESKYVIPKAVNIIEGSYACHPALWNYYDYRIFLNVLGTEQANRIRKRNPDRVDTFQNKWIPLEERYFYDFHILERCDKVLET